MKFSRRQLVMVGVLALALLAALGLWVRHEYWVKPMEIRRAGRIYLYENYSMVLRTFAQSASHSDEPRVREEALRALTWADWFDNRVRALKSASTYQPEEEKRNFLGFRKKNPGVASWDEAAGRIW